MKKVNIKTKTEAFNRTRLENKSKSFTYTELIALLKAAGIPLDITTLIIKHHFIDKEEVDGKMLYSFQANSLHMDSMQAFYDEKNRKKKAWNDSKKSPVKEALTERAALALLQSKGYRIKRIVGFDLERFMKEQPEMYHKYAKYEHV
jgi:hypothetical protein